MDLMEIALKHEIKGTPDGPFLYPYSIRGRKPFSLLTDDDESGSSSSSSNDEEEQGMGAKVKCIYDNDLYKKDNLNKDDDYFQNNKKRIQKTMYQYKSRRKGKEIEYISREDAFEMQYAKDFEFFFGIPYRPYIRLSSYRFGKNVKYPRDLKQIEAVYKKYPRYLFNDPWPEIDISKPIPYCKQKQPSKLVNERGVPIVWLDIIEKNKRHNIRKGNNLQSHTEHKSNKESPRTLSDAVVAWEVSSSLLNGDLPSIIGEDKKSRKQKRFSFVRDNIRGVAEEIESWTKCPVIQTDINKYLENSWKNIDKYVDNKNNEETKGTNDSNDKNISKLGSMKSNELKDSDNLNNNNDSSSPIEDESNKYINKKNISDSIISKENHSSELSKTSSLETSLQTSQALKASTVSEKVTSKVPPKAPSKVFSEKNNSTNLSNIPSKKGLPIGPPIKKITIPKKN